jgi:hypothetical protein
MISHFDVEWRRFETHPKALFRTRSVPRSDRSTLIGSNVSSTDGKSERALKP